MNDFNERAVRIQIKDQIDRMKRRKVEDEFYYSGSDEGEGSLEQPTIKKQREDAGEVILDNVHVPVPVVCVNDQLVLLYMQD